MPDTVDPYADNPAWPQHWGTCHLVGSFVGIDGLPTNGTISLMMAPDAVFVADDDVIASPAQIPLSVVDGVLDAYVPASDDQHCLPYGWTYHAVQDWDGREYDMVAPGGLSVDMTRVVPVGKYSGVLILGQTTAFVRTVNGEGPDADGNVVVVGGSTPPPDSGGATSDGTGGLTLTPGADLDVTSDGAGGLTLTGPGVTSDGAGALTITG